MPSLAELQNRRDRLTRDLRETLIRIEGMQTLAVDYPIGAVFRIGPGAIARSPGGRWTVYEYENDRVVFRYQNTDHPSLPPARECLWGRAEIERELVRVPDEEESD